MKRFCLFSPLPVVITESLDTEVVANKQYININCGDTILSSINSTLSCDAPEQPQPHGICSTANIPLQ